MKTKETNANRKSETREGENSVLPDGLLEPILPRILVLQQDEGQSPINLEGTVDLWERLTFVTTSSEPIAVRLEAEDIPCLIAAPIQYLPGVYLLETTESRNVPGFDRLRQRIPSLTPEQCASAIADLRHTRMQAEQEPAAKLRRAITALEEDRVRMINDRESDQPSTTKDQPSER